MARPAVTTGADVVLSYSGSTQNANLSATATNSPSSFQWTILSVPPGSTALVETRGSFVNGVANIQNPVFVTDAGIEGTYVIQCVATNSDGASLPLVDKENAQQNVVVRTQDRAHTLPNDYQYDWANYANSNWQDLEDAVTALDADFSSLDPHSLGGSKHSSTTLAALNALISDADLDDSTAPRTPTAHATSHQNGGTDEINVAGLNGVLADRQDADKLQGTNVSSSVPASGQALVYNGTQWTPNTLTTGTTTFLGLTDTPSSYSGQGGKVPAVNTGETGLEFHSTIDVTSFDSALPQITYSGVSLVNVAAWPGDNSTVYLTLQDGLQRSFTGIITFNPSTVADGGLDTGSEAANTWYYLYLVPKSGSDNLLVVRGSVNAPTTGPSGYTRHKYIGAVFNNASSDIRKFDHISRDEFAWRNWQFSGAIAALSHTSLLDPGAEYAISSVCPPVVGSQVQVRLAAHRDSAAGGFALFVDVWPSGETDTTSTSPTVSTTNPVGRAISGTDANDIDIAYTMISVTTPSAPKIGVRVYRNGGTVGVSYWDVMFLGWTDSYLTTHVQGFVAASGNSFLNLTDTPDTYAGQALKNVRVNAGATALEFVTASGVDNFLSLTDTPDGYGGAAGYSVVVASGQNRLEFIQHQPYLWFEWNGTNLSQFDTKVSGSAVSSSTVSVVSAAGVNWIEVSVTAGAGGSNLLNTGVFVPITSVPPNANYMITFDAYNTAAGGGTPQIGIAAVVRGVSSGGTPRMSSGYGFRITNLTTPQLTGFEITGSEANTNQTGDVDDVGINATGQGGTFKMEARDSAILRAEGSGAYKIWVDTATVITGIGKAHFGTTTNGTPSVTSTNRFRNIKIWVWPN